VSGTSGNGLITEAELSQLRSGTVLLSLAKDYIKGKSKQRGDEWEACCPFHDEKNPSFSVNTKEGLFHCLSCKAKGDAIAFLMKKQGLGFLDACDTIAARIGLQLTKNKKKTNGNHQEKLPDWQPIMPPPTDIAAPTDFSDPKLGRPSVVYEYVSAQGGLLYYVRRFDTPGQKKQIRPFTYGIQNGRRGWHSRHPAAPRPLFRLDAVTKAGDQTILLVEGEKAVLAAERLYPDYAVTTWPGGAYATEHADFSPLGDGSRVILWPDADDQGLTAMAEIAQKLPRARIVDVSDLTDGFDAADLDVDDPQAWLDARLRVELPPAPEKNETEPEAKEKKKETPPPEPIKAELWAWRDPRFIPPRPWLVGTLLIRGYSTLIASRGGTGKTAFAIAVLLSYITGRSDILGLHVFQPGNAWIITLEDDRLEMERRIAAAMLAHDIPPEAVEGRLFINDSTHRPIILAKTDSRGETFYEAEDAKHIEDEIRQRGIGITLIDPLVKAHRVKENDNGHMDALYTLANRVARVSNSAIMLTSHFRKGGNGLDRDLVRGAGAQTDAARINRLLQSLTPKEAENFGIKPQDAFRYVCIQDAKANLAPREQDDWFKLVSVPLGNTTVDPVYPQGDNVQAARHWKPEKVTVEIPEDKLRQVFDAIQAKPHGLTRQNQQLPWVGKPLQDIAGKDPKGAAKIVKEWLENAVLTPGDPFQHPTRKEKTFPTLTINSEKAAEILASMGRSDDADEPFGC
jgi:hypothetical protein